MNCSFHGDQRPEVGEGSCLRKASQGPVTITRRHSVSTDAPTHDHKEVNMKTQSRIAAATLFATLCLMLAATSAMAGTLYDNGPPNGDIDAWTINYGYTVSDSFVLPTGASEIHDIHFVYWDASTSDLLSSVDVQVGASSFGGTTQTLANGSNTFLGINAQGYALYQADFDALNIPWSNGGFLTLSNACTTSGCSTNHLLG